MVIPVLTNFLPKRIISRRQVFLKTVFVIGFVMAQGNTAIGFQALYDIIARLRAPGGCPWDREQTPSSLRECLIEETYECIEAVDEGNPAHIREELGDIFLLITMFAYIHEEKGEFSVSQALQTVCEKLIRRHPHVFGETKVNGTDEVLDNWAKIKAEQEGRGPKDSILDVSGGFPPLERAYKLQKKAEKAGFDWSDIDGVIKKINEELNETHEAVTGSSRKNIEEELGDLLFSVINLCRFLHVEPSSALHRTNNKFVNRFKHMEKRMRETGQEMKPENIGIMDRYWNEAKN
jgi:tetrapyrrole methylase family protein/MazG family protein